MTDEKRLPEEIEAIIKRGIDDAINRTLRTVAANVTTYPHDNHVDAQVNGEPTCCCCKTLQSLGASMYKVGSMREMASLSANEDTSLVPPAGDGGTEH